MSQEQRRRAVALLASSTDGVIEVDRDWIVTHVSDPTGKLIDPRAVGKCLWDVLPDGLDENGIFWTFDFRAKTATLT